MGTNVAKKYSEVFGILVEFQTLVKRHDRVLKGYIRHVYDVMKVYKEITEANI